ncbi:MAG: PilZ domain-containing protein [Gammaproteobacteria bacterium]|nr:MAG: PilZ domain-containing protein [Gammaproteobacteria bacterium]
MTDNRRQFSRIPFDAPARLEAPEGTSAEVHLLDICLKGVLISAPATPAPETGTLQIQLGEDTAIRMSVTQVHHEPGRLGYRCDFIDLDSIAALRRLVELNLGNAELLDREFGALLN